jgi:hypothetical protein
MNAAVAIKGTFQSDADGFQTMGTVRCDGCGEEFFVWHQFAFASPPAAERQAHWLEERHWPTTTNEIKKHCDRIELPDLSAYRMRSGRESRAARIVVVQIRLLGAFAEF